MKELFSDLETTLSPKEAWKREHKLITTRDPNSERWVATGAAHGSSFEADGNTEEAALDRLAGKLGIRFYK